MNVIQVRKYRKMIGAIFFLLAAVGVLLWQGEREEAQPTIAAETASVQEEPMTNVSEEDFYIDMRLERDRSRSEFCEMLTSSIQAEENEDARQQQKEELRSAMKKKQAETEIETMLKARGYADALVFCSGESVSAVVRTDELTREEVVEIAALIRAVSGAAEEHITIRAKP